MFHVVRGHTVKAVTESFKMSKDAGFKVVTHMMPDLPNVGLERDVEQFIVSICFLMKPPYIKTFSYVIFCVFSLATNSVGLLCVCCCYIYLRAVGRKVLWPSACVCVSVRTVFVRKISQERVHGSPPNLVGGTRG